MMSPDKFPVPDALSRPYWDAARERKLMIQRCPVTGKFQWYPRAHSLYAHGATPEWVQASGRAVLFSYSVIHRGDGTTPTPYTCAVVQLEEGVLFTATLKGIDEAGVRIGMALEVDFEQVSDELVLPFFKPAGPTQ
jgi:uncharacterized OB-fold protein